MQSNKLGNLYISQLHLFLIKNVNISKKECGKKGLMKAKKIEAVFGIPQGGQISLVKTLSY